MCFAYGSFIYHVVLFLATAYSCLYLAGNFHTYLIKIFTWKELIEFGRRRVAARRESPFLRAGRRRCHTAKAPSMNPPPRSGASPSRRGQL